MVRQSPILFMNSLNYHNNRSALVYCGDSPYLMFLYKVVECTTKKKLSRKTCRKSKKLIEEYGRRSEKCQWLESHIWHAKRFKMMEYHGHKIAKQCCEKGARATHRYYRTGCLLYVSLLYACYHGNMYM